MTAATPTVPTADELSGVLDLLDTAYTRLHAITGGDEDDAEVAELRHTLGLLTLDLEAVVGSRRVAP